MLRDLLASNLKFVICGTAVGDQSAKLQHYYAGKGNKFWNTISEIGLTPRQLLPSEYEKLLSFGIGLTDLVKNKSGMDNNLLSSDFGCDLLLKKIKNYKPKCLCFNGKRAAKEFLSSEYITYGIQDAKIGNTKLFVVPSTSSAANKWWNIDIWHDLADIYNEKFS